MLERQPDDQTALRYMTSKQLQQACDYLSAIQQQVCADIKSITSKRNRDKIFYTKKQTLRNNSDRRTDAPTDILTDGLSAPTDKIREDKIREDKSINNTPLTPHKNYEENFEEFWKMYIPVKCTDGRFTDKGSKQEAYKAFKKALQKDNIENIKAGLIRYLHKKSKTDSMTANVSTFLNQERWKDEPEQTFILSEKSQKQQKEDSGQEMYEMFQRFIKED